MKRRSGSAARPASERTWLERIKLPSTINEIAIPPDVRLQIDADRQRIEAFQDRWDVRPIEQFVAADYELVYQALSFVRQSHPLIGNRFL